MTAIRAVALLADRSAISTALESLASEDAAQRANALEVIETTGDPDLVRPCSRCGTTDAHKTSIATGETARSTIRTSGSVGAPSGRPRPEQPPKKRQEERSKKMDTKDKEER